MEIHSQLLLYLDKRRYLVHLKNNCSMFLDQLDEKTTCKFPPFRFLLEIDVMDLLDLFPELGELLLKEPLKFQRTSDDVLFSCLQTVNNTNKSVQFAQVGTNIRPRCLPRISVNSRDYVGLVYFEGLLLSTSKPASYVYHTVWSCPEECEGNEVILHYIPKTPPKCYVCRNVLFENSGLRRCGEQVIATFYLEKLHQSKSLTLVDDMLTKLNLGSKYTIQAVVLKKLTAVWSLEEVIPVPAPMTHTGPSEIEDLFKSCNGIPWKFIYCLASSIGINICPLNCFMHLKIALLLSLTSVKANAVSGSNIVHVLVGGFNTKYVAELMTEAAKLADRSVILGTSNTSVPTTLIRTSGGVTVMPLPLHVYNHKHISSVLSAIETGEIITDTAKAKLRTVVWAQGMDFKKIVLHQVASIFGTVCRGDYGEFSDEIVEFVLQQAIEPTKTCKEEIQALKDVELYIDLIAGIEVTLDKPAEILLRNYFLAARKERPRGVSTGSMSALVAMCLTSARLCRRKVANAEDAVFAIWLHVGGSAEPRFAPEEYLHTPADVKKLPSIINDFKDWLEQFTGSCIM